MAKTENEHLEDIEKTKTYIDKGNAATAGLSQEHIDYLLKRHGTLELDPLPGHGDADPYNWATWKVSQILSHNVHEILRIHSKQNFFTESGKPHFGCHPCLHVYLHCRCHNSSASPLF